MSKDLKILVKRAGKEPTVETIEDTVKAKQNLVGGLIEVISYDQDILLICNEEGKLFNLPPNLLFDYDYIAGDCFFVGDDYDNAGFKDLADEQIEDLKEMIKQRSIKYVHLEFENTNDERNI